MTLLTVFGGLPSLPLRRTVWRRRRYAWGHPKPDYPSNLHRHRRNQQLTRRASFNQPTLSWRSCMDVRTTRNIRPSLPHSARSRRPKKTARMQRASDLSLRPMPSPATRLASTPFLLPRQTSCLSRRSWRSWSLVVSPTLVSTSTGVLARSVRAQVLSQSSLRGLNDTQ